MRHILPDEVIEAYESTGLTPASGVYIYHETANGLGAMARQASGAPFLAREDVRACLLLDPYYQHGFEMGFNGKSRHEFSAKIVELRGWFLHRFRLMPGGSTVTRRKLLNMIAGYRDGVDSRQAVMEHFGLFEL